MNCPLLSVPDSPTGLLLDPAVTTIDISWSSSETNDHFYLTWNPAHGNQMQPVALAGDVTEFELTGLSPNTLYDVSLYSVSEGQDDRTFTISQATIAYGNTCK